MTTPLVGLLGSPGCGRHTVSRMLVREYGAEEMPLEEEVRATLLAIDPLIGSGTQLTDIHRVYGWEISHRAQATEVAYLLQRLKEAVESSLGPGAWVRSLARRLDDSEASFVCIPDLATASEVHTIHELGGIALAVRRPGTADVRGFGTCDAQIFNDGTRTQLLEKIRSLPLASLMRYTSPMTPTLGV